MSAFDTEVENVIDDETGGDPTGAYHNDPHDPGGETKWGISKRWYPDIDIKNLTRTGAVEIYRRKYWEAPGFDKVKNWGLAGKLFNIGVNVAPEDAVRFLQESANRLGAKLTVDGVLGSVTLKWVNEYRYPGALLMGLKIFAGLHYIEQGDSYHLAGWLLRLAR